METTTFVDTPRRSARGSRRTVAAPPIAAVRSPIRRARPHCADLSPIRCGGRTSLGPSVSCPYYRCVARIMRRKAAPVSYTHLRAHETDSYLVCRLLLEKKKNISLFYIMEK